LQEKISRLFELHPELASDEDFRADVIEGQTDAFEILETLCSQILEEKAFIEGVKERRKDLEARAERAFKRYETCRKLAGEIMEIADLRKANLKEATLWLAPSPPGVVLGDLTELPEQFWRQPPPEPDKRHIKEVLLEGRRVPGATLSNQPDTLHVRTR